MGEQPYIDEVRKLRVKTRVETADEATPPPPSHPPPLPTPVPSRKLPSEYWQRSWGLSPRRACAWRAIRDDALDTHGVEEARGQGSRVKQSVRPGMC